MKDGKLMMKCSVRGKEKGRQDMRGGKQVRGREKNMTILRDGRKI